MSEQTTHDETSPEDRHDEPASAAPPSPPPAPEASAPAVPAPAPQPVAQSYHRPPVPEKTPMLAGVLSAVIPGLGNIYNGLYVRGFSIFLIQVVLFSLAVTSGGEPDLAFLVPSLVFFWFFNIFDAYRQAHFINSGELEEPKAEERSRVPGALVPGIILLGLGVYGVLREYLDFRFDWVLDHWPVILLLVGGALVGHALWRLRQAEDESSSI